MILFLFLIIDLYFLFPVSITQRFNPIPELLTPIGIPSKEAKEEIEIDPVIAEAKKKRCSIEFRAIRIYKPFFGFQI